MSTIIDTLKQGTVPVEISSIAERENIESASLVANIMGGTVVVPRNNRHSGLDPIAIGKDTTIKINANIGTSPTVCRFEDEVKKVEIAISAGADTVMDLSIAGDIGAFRKYIIENINITLGTVPIYEAMIGLESPEQLSFKHFSRILHKQAEEGVDFMTIHSGLLQRHLPLIENRLLGVVSRGGSLITQWMRHHQKENFLFTHFDDILAIAATYDITLSLGDGLRPGCTADANDAAQFGELEILGELVKKCRSANVQVMIEGPGHVPMHLIKENIKREKEICGGAPFYVLGPLVIDYAAGYDHIAAAIGGAMAAYYGADFLCYVTPAEHLRLPTVEDVQEGVIASKIAASAVDLARSRPGTLSRNTLMSKARADFDWDAQKKASLNPEKFSQYLERVAPDAAMTGETEPCSMCGDWCAIKRFRQS